MTQAAFRSPSSLTIGCEQSPSRNHAPSHCPNLSAGDTFQDATPHRVTAAEPCNWLRELACFPTHNSLPSISGLAGPRGSCQSPPFPTSREAPPPALTPRRAHTHTHSPRSLRVPTAFSSCSGRSLGVLRGRRKGAWGRERRLLRTLRSARVLAQSPGGGLPPREMRGRR